MNKNTKAIHYSVCLFDKGYKKYRINEFDDIVNAVVSRDTDVFKTGWNLKLMNEYVLMFNVFC